MFANRLSNVIKASIVAGLVAGLMMGLFHFLVTERLIGQAIALESAASPGRPKGDAGSWQRALWLDCWRYLCLRLYTAGTAPAW